MCCISSVLDVHHQHRKADVTNAARTGGKDQKTHRHGNLVYHPHLHSSYISSRLPDIYLWLLFHCYPVLSLCERETMEESQSVCLTFHRHPQLISSSVCLRGTHLTAPQLLSLHWTAREQRDWKKRAASTKASHLTLITNINYEGSSSSNELCCT